MRKTLLFASSILALSLFASCDKTAQEPELVTYTITVEASKDASLTKALAQSGNTLNAVWGSSDVVTVYDSSNKSLGTLKPKSTGSSSASLSGTITASGLGAGTKLRLLAPRSSWLYSGQDGTFNSVSSKYAYASAEVTVTSVSGSNVLTSVAEFENQQAIVKFTLQDSKGAAIYPDELLISTESGKLVRSFNASLTALTGDISVVPDDDSNVFWVALRNDSGSADTYYLTATVGKNEYNATKAGVLFQNGKFYAGTVKMQEKVDVYTVTGGPATLFGSEWDPEDSSNDMTKQADGTYKSKTYNVTSDPTGVSFKIVKDHAYSNGEWGGDGENGNYVLTAGVGPLVIVFDPTTGKINATYTKSTAATTYTVAGSPASVFGTEWAPANTANDMTLQGDSYVKTYSNVAAGTTLTFKVVANHSWSVNYGKSACDQSDVTGDGDGNCVYKKTSAGAVTIKFNPTTKKITVS